MSRQHASHATREQDCELCLTMAKTVSKAQQHKLKDLLKFMRAVLHTSGHMDSRTEDVTNLSLCLFLTGCRSPPCSSLPDQMEGVSVCNIYVVVVVDNTWYLLAGSRKQQWRAVTLAWPSWAQCPAF